MRIGDLPLSNARNAIGFSSGFSEVLNRRGAMDVFAPELGDPVPCFRLSYVTPSDGYDLAAQRLRKARHGARFGHLEISRDADSLRNLLFVSVPSVWFSQMRIVIWLVVSKIFLISYVIYIYIHIWDNPFFYPSH